jgi:hypothetical protein
MITIKDAWRLWSVRLALILAFVLAQPDLVLAALDSLPAELRDLLPGRALYWLKLALTVLILIARITPQPKTRETIAKRDGKRYARQY